MVGPDWVAASVRARAIADQRIGAGQFARIAVAPSLEDALAELTDTAYGARLRGAANLTDAQAAVNSTVLWRLRVLAGWMPASGASLARTLAAGFERANILALAENVGRGEAAAAPYDLGTLATGWPVIRAAGSLAELSRAIGRSGWGDPGRPDTVAALADVLAVLWLRRLASAAPASRSWATDACALLAARVTLVDRTQPAARLVALMRPLLGTTWTDAHDLGELIAALPRSARPLFTEIGEPSHLWRAEARLGTLIERDALRLLRRALPGPEVVLGALAVMAVDAWRLRAALGAAAAGTGATAVGLEVSRAMA